jgi:hypothetical protein
MTYLPLAISSRWKYILFLGINVENGADKGITVGRELYVLQEFMTKKHPPA